MGVLRSFGERLVVDRPPVEHRRPHLFTRLQRRIGDEVELSRGERAQGRDERRFRRHRVVRWRALEALRARGWCEQSDRGERHAGSEG